MLKMLGVRSYRHGRRKNDTKKNILRNIFRYLKEYDYPQYDLL